MTTGRINQVTILSPDAAREGWAPEIPPKGRSCYKDWGTHEVDPAKRDRKRGRDLPPGGYSIAPTEFPKVRSAVGQSGPKTVHATPHTPLRWRYAITKSAPEGGYWRERSPQRPGSDSS